jgi:hypothetical protein
MRARHLTVAAALLLLPEAAFNEIDPRFNPHPPPAPARKAAGAMKPDPRQH